jgi:hypothetical protein
MIKTLKTGEYHLLETEDHNKILVLDDDQAYAWIYAEDIGLLLVTTHRHHKIDALLASGKYRLYDVKDEPRFTDLIHMELLVGMGMWQGYLLLSGLPTRSKTKTRIIPTDEVITSPLSRRINYVREVDEPARLH